MKRDILKRTKILADFLDWVYPYNPSFHTDWSSIMQVYDKIKMVENGRWEIQITSKYIWFIDSNSQTYEWERTNEKTMQELLFYAFSQYIGYGIIHK